MFGFLTDFHIGTKLSKSAYMKSLDFFIDHMKKSDEPCKMIFVCGDFFDHVLNISDYTFAAAMLLKLCNNGLNHGKNVPVHFIHGTYSHDNDQLMIFLPLLKKINPGVEYFKQPDFKMTNGIKVLYLPQIYNVEPPMAYFENVKYDIIVGHGVISSANNSPCKSKDNDVIYPTELLSSLSNICVFGHYHDYTEFDGNVFYGGAPLRWMYGENVQKGFLYCNDKFEPEFVPNPYAKDFTVVKINSPDELRKYLSSNIENPHRFVISINSEKELAEYKSIIDINKNNTNISFKISLNMKQDKQEENRDIVMTTHNANPILELKDFIKSRFNKDTSELIDKYVNIINKDSKEEK